MLDLLQKTRRDYNTIAPYFSDTRKYLWAELEQFKQFIQNGQRILDWGCGNGRLLRLLESFKDIEYFGLDQSEELLGIAEKAHAEAVASGRAHFFATGETDKHFPENFFDIIFMIASFHHLPSEESRLALLKKMHAELKTGGRLIVTVWNLDSGWAETKKNSWTSLGERDYLIPWKNPEGVVLAERYYHAFTFEELRSLATRASFRVDAIEYGDQVSTDDKGGRNLVLIATKV